MAQRKSKQPNAFSIVSDFAETVDTVFERLTGKPIAAWLKEFQQLPRELPAGEQTAGQSVMPLADAYAVLGLPPTATLEEVKRNYKHLAVVFHPDKKGGYTEAMALLNNAYERVMKEKGVK